MATTAARHWLVKSEPNKYSWQAFAREKKTVWDGVRNFEARNNLRAMKQGDLVLFYHSNEGKEIVGVAKVSREAYPDPTAAGEDWSAVELVPVKALTRAVTLAEVKADAQLEDMALVRRSRISVVPVTPAELKRVLALAQTKL
jgi:predicted RNA-binding protein with PUA-like domain